ncbi:SDR family oxidoreductase [Mycobacterium sp. M26]|uniref:SDR family oxidoreductase n=1 Tax=Mycobacterium sp. M26 TaxID=1762962 RepID=UPI00073E7EF0|nr:SDR family oxidoreductase [Mycobacterium sp. M26]
MVAVQGRVVVVTGGRRGLGAALVDEVLNRGAAKVYATAREPYTDARPAVVTEVLDVRSEASVSSLARRASDADILINNAGILIPAPLLTGAVADVAETFDVNALGPLRVATAFAPIVGRGGGGAIVNVLSVLSWLSGSGAYGASKAAMWSLTNSLRDELAAQQTQVLGVHAGFLDTDMVAAINVPKTPPAVAAARIIDALESGAAEVLIDDASVAAKAALSGPVENLSISLPG